MGLLIDNVTTTARETLIDADASTWSAATLLRYSNRGIAMACALAPDLYHRVSTLACVVGVRQTMPADALALIEIPRTIAGAPVLEQSLTELSRVNPTWPTDSAGTGVRYYMYDKRSPLTFLVYPAAAAAEGIELVYCATPADAIAGDTVPIPRWTETAIWAFTIGQAYAENSKKQDLTKSQQYMALFSSLVAAWTGSKDRTVGPPDILGQH